MATDSEQNIVDTTYNFKLQLSENNATSTKFSNYAPDSGVIFVFDELERRNIDYNKIALVDSTAIPHWDCPNFFDLSSSLESRLGFKNHLKIKNFIKKINEIKN